jgi:hypothetical protein
MNVKVPPVPPKPTPAAPSVPFYAENAANLGRRSNRSSMLSAPQPTFTASRGTTYGAGQMAARAGRGAVSSMILYALLDHVLAANSAQRAFARASRKP